MMPHIVLSVPGVRSASRPRALTENTAMRSTFLYLSLINAFATDMPGDPNRIISMMVAKSIQFMGQISLLWQEERVDRTIV